MCNWAEMLVLDVKVQLNWLIHCRLNEICLSAKRWHSFCIPPWSFDVFVCDVIKRSIQQCCLSSRAVFYFNWWQSVCRLSSSVRAVRETETWHSNFCWCNRIRENQPQTNILGKTNYQTGREIYFLSFGDYSFSRGHCRSTAEANC